MNGACPIERHRRDEQEDEKVTRPEPEAAVMIAPEGLEAGSDAVPRGEQADFEMRSGLQEPDDLLGVGRGDVGIEGEQAFDPLGAGGEFRFNHDGNPSLRRHGATA